MCEPVRLVRSHILEPLETRRMATSPVVLNPSLSVSRLKLRSHWLAAICAIVFVCFTSTTFMGCRTTQALLNFVWASLFGHWHWDDLGMINGVCRKTGHFLGYGTIGLIFRRAWYSSIRAWALLVGAKLKLASAALGVASTFVVASLDEWHQTFLPGRCGRFRDVIVDTCGAAFLTAVFFLVREYRRRKALPAH